MQLTKLIFPKTHLFVFLNAHRFVLWIMESAMNLPASPRSLSRSADFGLLRIDRGLDRMADGIERCRLAAGKRIPFGEMS